MKMNQTADDAYWIEQYRLGNQEGMRVLYQRYFQKVYYKCLSLCKDPDQAFDLAQDVLLKAFEHLHSFRGRLLSPPGYTPYSQSLPGIFPEVQAPVVFPAK
jgi:hypothetical protein